MKKLLVALIALCALAGCAIGPGNYDLRNDGKNTDNILTYGMGYHQQRHSPLRQINRASVKRLAPVWSSSLNNDLGEQAQPMVYNGMLFVPTVKATFAFDVATGRPHSLSEIHVFVAKHIGRTNLQERWWEVRKGLRTSWGVVGRHVVSPPSTAE